MNPKSLAFVSCRLFALYAVSQIFIWIVYIYNGSNLPPALTAGHYSMFAVVPLATLVLGLFFWLKAEWLAEKIVGTYTTTTMNPSLTLEDIQTAGFAIIGMLLFADIIPVIAGDIVSLFLGKTGTRPPDSLPHYIRLGCTLVIAIWLVFGASWFTRFAKKLRGL